MRIIILLLAFFFVNIVQAKPVKQFIETPILLEQVQKGELPPVALRLPEAMQVVSFLSGFKAGEHGGEMRLLMGKQKDIRQVVVYGYARLVGYTTDHKLKADLLESIDVVDKRIFTMHIRKGHKWSDGHPFSSEDFRYYWEDIAKNKALSKGGPPKKLVLDGELPQVEYLDDLTVRYSWSKPNPFFLAALAGAKPLYIYKPAHFLKQFHKDYQSKSRIDELIKTHKKRNWQGVHISQDRSYKATNPKLPSLQPWVNSTPPPSERFIFKRNPYYHKVDINGRQLPYIDAVIVTIVSKKLISAKAGADEADLQARYLRMDNYTFLKQGEGRNNYKTHLWKTTKGAHMALFPNLNASDKTYLKLLRDVRFRRALSLAIHRHEVNQVVYFGLVQEGNNTVLIGSPLYKPEYQKKWASYDLATANDLLDELGLTQRDDRGVRIMEDGRPLEILVQTAGESTEQTDVLELIHDSWLKAGIKLYSVPSSREVFRNRVFAGDAIMSIWSGLENAMLTADLSPAELAPSNKYQYNWPKWGEYIQTSGKSGEKSNVAEVLQLIALNKQWLSATSHKEQSEVWHKMLDIHKEQIFSIGIISAVLQPVVVNKYLRNVPTKGFYNFMPGAYFGVYKPDGFWFTQERR